MRPLIFVAMSIICSLQCIAQGERNNWYFGDSIKFVFNPVLISISGSGKTASSDVSAVANDKYGDLQFYTCVNYLSWNYSKFWNKQNQVMQNSNGIFGGFSNSQGQIILSNPSDSNSYYLFSLALKQGTGIVLYYSTVDMLLDSNRGAVVQKNILLCDTALCEKMTAVKHGNGRDWWLFVHEVLSNNFFEYLITPTGISAPTVISVGSCIGCNNTYDQGQMVFSKDGSKLCVANGFGILDLFDFDRCSGVLTLNQNLGLPHNFLYGWTTFYGCSFSADGQLLYASRFDTLWQYDLNASNIKASRLYLMSVDNAEYFIGHHLLGPDNKIYISTGRNNGSSDSLDYKLSVINYPDSVGLACDLRPHSIWLGGHRARGGLPNLPHYELGALTGSVCDTITGIPGATNGGATRMTSYPNPVLNELAIKSGQWLSNQTVTVTVYDVIGKQKMQQLFTTNYGNLRLDLRGLASGLYFLKVQQNGKVYSTKFVKE